MRHGEVLSLFTDSSMLNFTIPCYSWNWKKKSLHPRGFQLFEWEKYHLTSHRHVVVFDCLSYTLYDMGCVLVSCWIRISKKIIQIEFSYILHLTFARDVIVSLRYVWIPLIHEGSLFVIRDEMNAKTKSNAKSSQKQRTCRILMRHCRNLEFRFYCFLISFRDVFLRQKLFFSVQLNSSVSSRALWVSREKMKKNKCGVQ